MAAALIGNIMMSNIRTSISATTATGVTSDSNQVLASNILANPTLGSGNYTYQWSQSGTTITFTAATSNSTNCTYGSLSVSGSTTIFCTVTDTWTGVKSVTSNCVITWPVQTITQNIVISGSPTYNGSGQAYTLTASTGPAPTGSPASFTNAGTYNSSNITLTPSAGYVIGTVTGSFTINKATISGTAASPSTSYNAASQSGTVITGVTAGATFSGSVTASGTNAGNYTSSITGTGNYQGTVNGGTFTIAKKQLTITGTAGITFCSYNPNPGQFLGQTLTVSLNNPGSPPSCQGLLSGGIGTLTTYLVDKATFATSVAPVSTNDNNFVDAVSVTQGVNPKTGLSNGTQTVNVCFPSGTYYYGFSFGGDSNYLPSPVTALNGDSCNT
jgi:hypothetical protein